MFSLKNQTARLCNLNPRAETHGDQKVPACDLKFEIAVSNDVLSEFDPALKSAFYRKMGKSEVAGDLADQGGAAADGLVKLKFTHLTEINWGQEYAGYGCAVEYGIGGSNVAIEGCGLSKIAFTLKDGGTVVMKFSVAAKPTEADVGKLYGMLGREVTLTLTEPEAE